MSVGKLESHNLSIFTTITKNESSNAIVKNVNDY